MTDPARDPRRPLGAPRRPLGAARRPGGAPRGPVPTTPLRPGEVAVPRPAEPPDGLRGRGRDRRGGDGRGPRGRDGDGRGAPDVVPGRPAEPWSGLRRRLVELARTLAGGLVVLALVVAVGPLVLGDRGPGAAVVVGHLVGAVIAVAATAVAASPRTRPVVALVAAASVPVVLAVVLGVFWWR